MTGAAAAALLLVAAAWAGPYAVGTTVARLSLEDQHGARADVDERVATLLITGDMDGGNVLKAAFAGVEQELLDRRRAVYVADISGMPGLVSRLIAVPRMRQRAYRVLLDRDGSATRSFGRMEGRVTVVSLDRLRITDIRHLDSAADVRAAVSGPHTAE